RALQRPGMGAVAVLLDPDSARNPRRRDRAARAHDHLVCIEGQLPASPSNRAMDLAAVDVRVGDGRDRLPDAVQDVHADLSTAGDGIRDVLGALKKRGGPLDANRPSIFPARTKRWNRSTFADQFESRPKQTPRPLVLRVAFDYSHLHLRLENRKVRPRSRIRRISQCYPEYGSCARFSRFLPWLS